MDEKTIEEQVKAAGSAEEMFEIFSKSKPEAKELSLDDLDKVAGGAPEMFTYLGHSFTPADLVWMTGRTIREGYVWGAYDVLLNIVRTYPPYKSIERDVIIKEYESRGADMFTALDKYAQK